MKSLRLQHILALSLAVGCLLLAACQSDQSAAEQRYYTKLSASSYPRSMVFDSPHLHSFTGGGEQNELPWYADRNDWQPNVIAGYRGATIETSVTWTYDHQYQSNGNVYNNVDNATYRSSYTQGVR